MRDSGLDLFDPRTAVVDSDYSSSPSGGRDPDFGFAFNDSNFSDRVLRIEIVADPTEARTESETCQTLADWAARKSKRRRGDIVKKENGEPVKLFKYIVACMISLCLLHISSTSTHSYAGMGCAHLNQTCATRLQLWISTMAPKSRFLDCQPDAEDAVGEENHDEEEIPMIEDSPSGDEAANSDDSNWSEDGSRVIRVKSLHISSPHFSAKSPFFYKLFSNGMMESEQRHVTLRINASAPALLDVLMAADKFESQHYCIWICLFGILMAEAVQPLTDAAKQFLAARYKDISNRFQDEVMNLPLAGIEAILSSDDLQVASEDAVLTCNDFDHEFATKAVLDALFFKAEAPHRQRTHALEESTSTSRRFVERAYKYRPVKVVEFEHPRQQCVVYLDLKREECANLFPSGRVYSQAFHLGGQGFSCPRIATWTNKARFIVSVFFWGCKKRVP
ncbi:hypothetical protein DH2020_023096 [Rehmannia glutinosa]|uniref:BTB domain-containing protein n=1 Tax=Rehmannia glutinosa TaxID=99300 RepID=A0ABR0W539_REHGL